MAPSIAQAQVVLTPLDARDPSRLPMRGRNDPANMIAPVPPTRGIKRERGEGEGPNPGLSLQL